MSKTLSIVAVLAASIASLPPAFAADEYNTVPGLTAAGAPLGLHGVDPVAFVQLENRIEGSATYTATHDGVAYYFASEDNMNAFMENPAQYEPQNGGFCTFGVSVSKKFDGNPHYAAIVDGKLYLFLNEGVLRAFQRDPEGTIVKAEANWKSIQHTAASDL